MQVSERRDDLKKNTGIFEAKRLKTAQKQAKISRFF
jgi:hypothetical protein